MIVSKVLQENSMFKRDKNFFLHIFNEWTKKEKEYNLKATKKTYKINSGTPY